MLDGLAQLFALPLGAESPHFEQALVHPSFANEQPQRADNQRLEFLGDAVLQLCASEYLFQAHPNANEGELTRRRARLVSSEALGGFARDAGIESALRLGKGAEAHGLRSNTSVLADAVEALIAAVYLDGGIEAARQACRTMLGRIEAGLDADALGDTKSSLQEAVQARGKSAPSYRVIASGGPAHEPWFEVSVSVDGKELGSGRGRNKRSAEREAARQALELLPGVLGDESTDGGQA
jgi:ribonuclease-3